MATLTASAAQANVSAKFIEHGQVTRVVHYTIAASFSAGDVVQMCKVPMGAAVNGAQFAINGHSGVLTVNVGDGNDVSAYAASVVLSGSAVALASMPARGLGRSYSAEDTVDIQIAAISAPVAAGTLTLVLSYTLDNQQQ